MRTPRLFKLGCTLFAFGIGFPALAEEVPAEAGPEAAASSVEIVTESAPPGAEPEAVSAAAGMSETAVADAAEVMEPAEVEATGEMPASAPESFDPATLESEDQATGLSDAGALEMPADEPADAPLPAATAGMTLGDVGYDDQGREGRIHLVSSGDTLWDISNGYLGTPWVWPSIWQDNQNIENPHLIFPGDRIWITPWEMRKLTDSEAEALLAGTPAAGAEAAKFAGPSDVSPPASPAPLAEMVPQELVKVTIPNRERAGLISSEMLDASASVLANVSPTLMISQADRVWIGLADGETRPGEQFTIFRVQEKVYDPETSRVLGHHVIHLGWLEVVETHDESSMALVRASNSEIAVGDKIMPRVAVDPEVAITTASAGVEGQISFLPNSRTHVGSADFVYLNRGVLDGVDVGTPLTVVRKGFRTRDDVLDTAVQVPDRPVGSLLVVRAEDEASVALVRKAEDTLVLGDYFRGASN